MAKPIQVRKAAQESDDFAKKLASAGNTDTSALNIENDLGDKSENAQTKETKTAEEIQSQKETEQPGASEQGNHTNQEEETWKQRYLALQGKFNKEIPILNQRVKELESQLSGSQQPDTGEIDKLKGDVTSLREQLNVAQQQNEQSAAFDPEKLEELQREHGADLVDGILSYLDGKLAQTVKPLAERVNTIDQSSTDAAAKAAYNVQRQKLSEALASHGVDLNQQNTDPLFNDWLELPDEFSGQKRSDLLNRAFRSGDTESTAKIFLAYAKGSSNPSTNQSETNLEKHVNVETDALDNPDATAEGGAFISKAELVKRNNELFRRKRNGEVSQKEFDRLEKELMALVPRVQN